MKTCSILLVNDDPEVIAAVHEALAGVRHRLMVGPTAEAAISALNDRRCSFEVLLVDLTGGLGGFAVFDAVHACCAQLPVIALTPADEWFVKEEAFLHGGSVLLDKPVRAEEVAEAVRHACGCAQAGGCRERRCWMRGGGAIQPEECDEEREGGLDGRLVRGSK